MFQLDRAEYMQTTTSVNTPNQSATRFLQTQNVSRHEIVSLIDGDAVTTTLAIAIGCNVDHASVIKLVRTYQADLEEFGLLGFEIQPRPVGQHGGADTEFAILNEQQSTLIMTYMRNSPIVREFKKTLVKEFWLLVRGKPVALPSYAETLRLYADQIEQTAVLQIANIQQAKKIESLEHLFMAGETPSQFVKRLNGVNAQKINATLLELGWIYNAESEPDRSPKYRTTSKARSQLLLTERPRKIDGEGFEKPFIRYDLQMLESGATKLHNLYLDLRLTMKKTWDQQFFYAKFAEEASQ